MPSIRDRDEGHARRKERLATIKKGPGTFVYTGDAVDIECVPTPKLVGRDAPALDKDGMPIRDAAGRQVFQPAGRHATDDEGQIILGGVPKYVKTPIEVFKIRGIDFPARKPVNVSDPSTALKLRGMDIFEEVDDNQDHDDSDELSGLNRKELMSLASQRGLNPMRTDTVSDLREKLKAFETEMG